MINKKDILKQAVTKGSAEELGKKLGVDFKKFTVSQFVKGLKFEREHKDLTKGDPIMTAKIAIAHLNEIPDYYSRLEIMEDEAKKDVKNKEE